MQYDFSLIEITNRHPKFLEFYNFHEALECAVRFMKKHEGISKIIQNIGDDALLSTEVFVFKSSDDRLSIELDQKNKNIRIRFDNPENNEQYDLFLYARPRI